MVHLNIIIQNRHQISTIFQRSLHNVKQSHLCLYVYLCYHKAWCLLLADNQRTVRSCRSFARNLFNNLYVSWYLTCLKRSNPKNQMNEFYQLDGIVQIIKDQSRLTLCNLNIACLRNSVINSKVSVKRNLSFLQSDIHWNPLHQNDSYLDTDEVNLSSISTLKTKVYFNETGDKWSVSICWPTFIDTPFWHTFSHSLCTEALFYETVSVIAIIACMRCMHIYMRYQVVLCVLLSWADRIGTFRPQMPAGPRAGRQQWLAAACCSRAWSHVSNIRPSCDHLR